MKITQGMTLAFAISLSMGCTQAHKQPIVVTDIRRALDEANLWAVRVKQDKRTGEIVLRGNVTKDGKYRADVIATALKGNYVISDRLGVCPNDPQDDLTEDPDSD